MPVIVVGALAVVFVVGLLVSSVIFRANSYKDIIQVQEGDFAKEVDTIDFASVPRIDRDASLNIANRSLGALSDLVSQFKVNMVPNVGKDAQINYKNTPVRVVPLEYANLIKWFTNRSNGLPGYIVVEDKKKMVILGDGPVALAFLSCAKLMGIQEIYVLGNHRDKLETAEKLGAAGTFLNKDEEEKKKASDLFDRKSDICIDTIGSNQTITQCLDYIKETGTIAVYGLKSGENLNVPLPELRNFNIQYVQWPVPEVEAEVHKPVCDAIMDGKIDIDLFVTHRFSIDDYEKGFQAVKDRTALKVVLNF